MFVLDPSLFPVSSNGSIEKDVGQKSTQSSFFATLLETFQSELDEDSEINVNESLKWIEKEELEPTPEQLSAFIAGFLSNIDALSDLPFDESSYPVKERFFGRDWAFADVQRNLNTMNRMDSEALISLSAEQIEEFASKFNELFSKEETEEIIERLLRALDHLSKSKVEQNPLSETNRERIENVLSGIERLAKLAVSQRTTQNFASANPLPYINDANLFKTRDQQQFVRVNPQSMEEEGGMIRVAYTLRNEFFQRSSMQETNQNGEVRSDISVQEMIRIDASTANEIFKDQSNDFRPFLGNAVPSDHTQLNQSNDIQNSVSDLETVQIHRDRFLQEMTDFFVSKLRFATKPGGGEARITLYPAELGHIDVRIALREGEIIAQLIAETNVGKELLESQVAHLRHALQQQGIQVSRIDIQTSAEAHFMNQPQHDERPRQQNEKQRSSAVVEANQPDREQVSGVYDRTLVGKDNYARGSESKIDFIA